MRRPISAPSARMAPISRSMAAVLASEVCRLGCFMTCFRSACTEEWV